MSDARISENSATCTGLMGGGMGRNYSVHNTMQRAKSTLFPRA